MESKEHFAGYLTVDSASPERAAEIAAGWPDVRFGGAMEVRAILERVRAPRPSIRAIVVVDSGRVRAPARRPGDRESGTDAVSEPQRLPAALGRRGHPVRPGRGHPTPIHARRRRQPAAVTRICISHFHGDHCLGLPGMIMRLALDNGPLPVPVHYPGQRRAVLPPPALRLGRSRNASTSMRRPVAGPGIVHVDDRFTLRCARLAPPHRDVRLAARRAGRPPHAARPAGSVRDRRAGRRTPAARRGAWRSAVGRSAWRR